MAKLDNFTTATPTKDVFETLRSVVNKRIQVKDRFCIVLFDEYSLDGAEKGTVGEGPFARRQPPTHVVSFVLRGLHAAWKQPVANVFWRQQGAGAQLAQILRQVIRDVFRAGLTVLATVSDASQINVDAIRHLGLTSEPPLPPDSNGESFVIDCNVIHHVYEPCRLLKAVRNNLLKYDLIFEVNGQRKLAKWTHIQRMFAVDRARGCALRLPKLTIRHVRSRDLDRRVNAVCTQLFSESVATEMIRSINNGDMEAEALDTAELVLFLDKLFDSCNAETEAPPPDKPLRCALKGGSPHLMFWSQAEQILDSMRFQLPDDHRVFRPQCLDKWAVTLYGIFNVWKTIRKYKIKSLSTRRFNLDVLTNFMQIVRIVNSVPGEVYCEPTEGDILDLDVLDMVMASTHGYSELK